jgi:hypothetical protein
LGGAENWALRKTGQKYLERFEMWYWRGMEKIGWTERVRNVCRVKEERYVLHTMKMKEGRLDWSHLTCELLSKHVIEGKVEVTVR